MEPSLEEFSAAVCALYSAASDPRLWTSALGAVERLTGSGALINIADKHSHVRHRHIPGERIAADFDAAVLNEWIDNFATSCPRMTAAESAPHAPFIVDAMLLTESQMDRHAVYDWYTKHDVRYTIGSGLIDTDRLHVNWSLERSNGQGHADRTDVDLFLLIKPHLAQAVSLALQVGSLTGLTPATMAILDCIPHAAFALDRAARVIAVSRRAELLLVRGDGLSVVKGRLAATAANDNSALLRAIVTAQRGIGGWLRVRRSSGSAPYLLSVLPLGGESEHPLAPQASVLIFVQDPSERRGVSCDLLMAMFGFTPAEARLASALSFGHSLESAAQLLHLSVQTERSYLKAIFRKTAVNRQQDLVRLLASLPFPNGAGAVSH